MAIKKGVKKSNKPVSKSMQKLSSIPAQKSLWGNKWVVTAIIILIIVLLLLIVGPFLTGRVTSVDESAIRSSLTAESRAMYDELSGYMDVPGSFDFDTDPITGRPRPDGVLAGFATQLRSGEILEKGDNCPTIYNPDQTDSDKDGVGDACDRCPPGRPNKDKDSFCDDSAQDDDGGSVQKDWVTITPTTPTTTPPTTPTTSPSPTPTTTPPTTPTTSPSPTPTSP